MSQANSMGAVALGREIARGNVDPVDLVAETLDAIANHPFGDRIYARTTPERAMAEATAARERARAGLRTGPLDGVPISWKDLFDTAGTATEAGSKLLAGRVPNADAHVLQVATHAGAVCIGKTHMTELAFSGLGLNPSTASPPCINDHDAVSGGSSSGAATSMAFGLAAAAVGSDTGGSVRVPAAWNDLVGLKTTSGRLSLRGVVPLAARFDTVGPITRNVEDAAVLFATLAGVKAPDLRGTDITGRRFLILNTIAMDDLSPQSGAGFESSVKHLRDAGAIIEHADIPQVGDAMALSGVLYAPEAYGTWRDVIEAAPDKMFPPILARFRGGRDFTAAEYVKAWQDLDRLRAEFAAMTAGYDAVIMPTVANLPPNADRLLNDPDYFTAENLLALRNTRIGNLMGGCALTLPTGVASTGIMFLTPHGDEMRLLRLGAAVERVLT